MKEVALAWTMAMMSVLLGTGAAAAVFWGLRVWWLSW
jgi:hypothetical protein